MQMQHALKLCTLGIQLGAAVGISPSILNCKQFSYVFTSLRQAWAKS